MLETLGGEPTGEEPIGELLLLPKARCKSCLPPATIERDGRGAGVETVAVG